MELIGEAEVRAFVDTDEPGPAIQAAKIVRWIESLPLEVGDEIVVIRRSAREKAAA